MAHLSTAAGRPRPRRARRGEADTRILLVAPQPFYEDRGTPIAVRQLLEALSRLGYAVDVLTFPMGEEVEIPGVRIVRSANPFGVRRVPIGLSLRKVLLDASLVAALRERLRERRYACIHAVEEAAFPAVLLGRAYGVPVVYDMQSSLPEQLQKHRLFRTRWGRRATDAAERWLLRRANAVVAFAGLAARVREQAPGTAVSEWRFANPSGAADPAAVAALRGALGIAAGARVVVYSGTFEPYQGLATLLAAVPRVRARFPDAVFVLVGAEGEPGAEVARAARALADAAQLRILPRQPRSAVPAFFALADVVVSPRAYGGNLPLKIFDYLAAGRPIVATDIPTHRSVLNPERALLVPPSAEGLADGIVELLGDPERAARLGAAGREYAAERLGWPAFVRSVEELYRGVLARHAARASGG